MATPQEIRIKRLKKDWEEMRSISCPVIGWTAAGDPPTRYVVSYRIESIVDPQGDDGKPAYRGEHKVLIEIPSGYPLSGESPVARMDESYKPVFHPNFWPGGLICIWGGGTTNWNPTDTIALLCIRIARMLQFDEVLTQESHRANAQAADWYAAKKHSGLFPTDTQVLPIPSLFDDEGDFVFL